ncbi:arylsulfatase, partial [Salmonella enterica subsp. enterica serovar Kentucky]
MNKKSSSMVNMPAPREPINQKIDTNNALVLNHNAIYEQRLAEITQSNTSDKAIVTVN